MRTEGREGCEGGKEGREGREGRRKGGKEGRERSKEGREGGREKRGAWLLRLAIYQHLNSDPSISLPNLIAAGLREERRGGEKKERGEKRTGRKGTVVKDEEEGRGGEKIVLDWQVAIFPLLFFPLFYSVLSSSFSFSIYILSYPVFLSPFLLCILRSIFYEHKESARNQMAHTRQLLRI